MDLSRGALDQFISAQRLMFSISMLTLAKIFRIFLVFGDSDNCDDEDNYGDDDL